MTGEIEQALARWREAGILDAGAADRITAFELGRAEGRGLRWPVILALVFGGVMLAAGVLLFVAAHWDTLSPAQRAAIVFAMVAVFHIAGAFAAPRSEAFATLLHGLGTIALGAGISLLGQIFNMQEHWPAGVGLWAAGAWAGWLLRRDWVQIALAALLTPAWIEGEWLVRAGDGARTSWIAAIGAAVLATVYLSARTETQSSAARRALTWIGGLAIFPCAIAVIVFHLPFDGPKPVPETEIVGWMLAVAAPLGLAWILRRRAAWMNAAAAVCVIVLGLAAQDRGGAPVYLWSATCAAGLAAWGFVERRSERINLGFAGFALSVLFFYFSELMDKLGRSVSLIVLGLLVLAGGWALEQTRRRLIAGTRAE
jgi:uncharacterized membrane protein